MTSIEEGESAAKPPPAEPTTPNEEYENVLIIPLSGGGDSFKQPPVKRAARRNSGGGIITPPVAPNRLRLYKSNSRSKWVTREIAALEFLLGIPLESEQDIVKKGWMQQQGLVEGRSKRTDDEEEEKMEVLEPPNQTIASRSSQSSTITNHSFHGRWWEKWVNNPKPSGELISRRSRVDIDEELEQPHELSASTRGGVSGFSTPHEHNPHNAGSKSQPVSVPVVHAPGRRLQGDEATKIQIPIMDEATVITRQKSIARLAFTREWEIKVAHGIGDISSGSLTKIPIPSQKQIRPPMLDGRLFFSAGESYPMQVFSLLRYEPKKEEAARRRQKLEARGGGGTQFFIMPVRDWRGISYRALLPPKKSKARAIRNTDALLRFDRFASSSSDNLESRSKNIENEKLERSIDNDLDAVDESDESDEEDTYIVGLLDDPEMVQGRHRTVMIGDRVTGPIVSSNIQFVKPQILKADLNQQFRARFDGWEPPKLRRKYILARVVDGLYTLDSGATADDATIGTVEEDSHQQTVATTATNTTATTSFTPRKRQGSISSLSTGGGDAKESIRMPPSLTLSKIRSIKQQALLAAVAAKLEISTVALSIVYFERLCLDCRVDKTNRRLSFAACLLLALKMNEAHVELVMTRPEEGNSKSTTTNRIQSLIRPAKKSDNVFASLLEFFTQEWNLSLKHLFAAEWGVFAALQFRLHVKPSHVAFHFKRLLKAMDWNPRAYLGPQMYAYWMDALAAEEYFKIQRQERREARQELQEHKKMLQLQRELAAANRSELGSSTSRLELGDHHQESSERRGTTPIKQLPSNAEEYSPLASPKKVSGRQPPIPAGIGRILNHLTGAKRSISSDKLERLDFNQDSASKLVYSPSMPVFPIGSDIIGGSNFVIDVPSGDKDDVTNRPQANVDEEEAGIIV